MSDSEYEAAVQVAEDKVESFQVDGSGMVLSHVASSASVGKRVSYTYGAYGAQTGFTVEDI